MAETVRDLRRGQILAAARAIVAEGGLDALTIRTLEERLGFTRGVISYHFAGKDEIVDAVFQSAIADIDAATHARVEAGATAADKVRAIIAGNVQGFVEHVEAGRILLSMWGRLAQDPAARRTNATLYATYRRRTARLLRAAQDAGGFRAVDPEAMATVIVGLVLGIATQHYFDPKAVNLAAAIDAAVQAVLACA